MIVVTCIVSGLLIFSIGIIILLLRALKNIFKGVKEVDDLEEEIAFLEGNIDIDDSKILNKFTNAIIVCHLEKDETLDDYCLTKIVDISSYQKNHVIGLTYFVQPQFFDNLKDSTKMDNLRKRILEDFIEDRGINPDEADMEFIESIVDEAMGQVLGDEYHYDEEAQTMTRPLMPHCTVLQLKDGRWIWRQELD